jgi:hypothetical protein
MGRFGPYSGLVIVTVLAVVAGLLALDGGWRSPAGCTIKGNISQATGQRIYHLPDDEFYRDARISWLRGERWFCSEAEARAAGWRRARV